MSYRIVYHKRFLAHIELHKRSGNKHLVSKAEMFIAELREHPRSGIGKPEQLKYYEEETWSRRIDQRHRLLYEIHDEELIVIAISAYGHYE